MITKPTIIITSLGRTGTKFFYTLFRELMLDGTSLHEPDVLNVSQYHGAKKRFVEIIKQARESGIFNLFIRKALGRWSLIKLSDSRVRGELGYSEAVQRVLNQREGFINSRPGSVYIESSIAYYGLIDVLKDACKYHTVAYIVRDGRDWIRSWMSWSDGAGMYDKSKLRGLVAHTWPKAPELKDDPYAAKWQSMSRFERLCWAWDTLNEYALRTVEENSNAKVFRFEDLFRVKDRYRNLEEMVQFLTTFPDCDPVSVGPLDEWLDREIHKSSGQFPTWPNWTEEQKHQFRNICGTLMEKLGYDFD